MTKHVLYLRARIVMLNRQTIRDPLKKKYRWRREKIGENVASESSLARWKQAQEKSYALIGSALLLLPKKQ